jgi:hypothetical protein
VGRISTLCCTALTAGISFGCGGEEPDPDLEIKRSTLIVAAQPPGHTFEESVSVELSTEGPSQIFYTLNGDSPFGDAAILYDGPIVLDENALLTFVAKEGELWSEPVTELYERHEDLVAPDPLPRALWLDDDQLVFSARRGDEGPMRKSVVVRASGIQAVSIHDIYITINPDSWSFWEEGIFQLETAFEAPGRLAPGESIELVVSYIPTETLRTAVLVLESDDQRTMDGVVTIDLTGRIWDW